MILFRADGNPEIGSGHVMRCLSIADAAKDQGLECRFAVADGSFSQTVRDRGFSCEVLGTDYRHMDAERDALARLLLRDGPAAMVVDSYFVTPEYLTWLGRFADVTYIDDLAAFAYPVKNLVNYNIYGPELDYEGLYKAAGVPAPRLLLGPRYAPLRKQFQNIPPRVARRAAADILVSTGGADPEHMALRIARYLISWRPASRYVFHLVAGGMNPDVQALRQIAKKCPWMQLHENVQDMAALMCRCDLAIAAAGSTLYELCACGVPTITYAFADNQLLGMEAFEKQGMMQSAGDIRLLREPEKAIMYELDELARDSAKRERMRQKMRALSAGDGANKILDALCTSRRV